MHSAAKPEGSKHPQVGRTTEQRGLSCPTLLRRSALANSWTTLCTATALYSILSQDLEEEEQDEDEQEGRVDQEDPEEQEEQWGQERAMAAYAYASAASSGVEAVTADLSAETAGRSVSMVMQEAVRAPPLRLEDARASMSASRGAAFLLMSATRSSSHP